MDAPLTTNGTQLIRESDDCFSRIARQSISIAAIPLVSLSVLVCIRGLFGILQAPNSTLAQLLPVIVVLSFASVFRVLWQRLYPNASSLHRLVSRLAIPSACIGCVAIALSTSGIGFVSCSLLWLAVASSELTWWYPTLRARVEPTLPHGQPREARQELEQINEEVAEEDELDLNVTQQLTRSTNEDGIEVITGILRANFNAGERTRNLHVAFCPPLEYQPKIVVHQLDDASVVAKVAQAETFGARIELRLQTPATLSEIASVYFETVYS